MDRDRTLHKTQADKKVEVRRRIVHGVMASLLAKAVIHIALSVLGLLVVATGFAAVKHLGPFEPKPPGSPGQTVVLDSLVRVSDYYADHVTYTANFVIHEHSSGFFRFLAGDNLKVTAMGSVDVIENFSSLTGSAIRVTSLAASVLLPVPYFGPTNLDIHQLRATVYLPA